MSIADVPSSETPAPTPTLAMRRPGHAAMTYLLSELQKRSPETTERRSVPDDLRSWLIGAQGEVLVGQELALLSPEWHVLHAVPAGSAGADIDHLVIGPGGVFVLNTKHHALRTIRVGTHVVWINGFQQSNYQAELLRRCGQVRRVLFPGPSDEAPVVPVLVFVRPKRFDRSGPQQVTAVTSSALIAFLHSRPLVLSAEAVAALASAAADPATWGATPRVLDEPDPTLRFLDLEPARVVAPHRTHPQPRMRPQGRVPARAARRLIAVFGALIVSLVVLPAAFAGIVGLLGLYFQMLIGR